MAVVRAGSAEANHGKRSGRGDSSVAAVVRVGLAEMNHPELSEARALCGGDDVAVASWPYERPS